MAASFLKSNDTDPDPTGDLILLLGSAEGDEVTRVRVSSKVMSLASPVMAAMLSPRYSEGNTLSEKGFLELALPEDDTEAMIWLCKAFHHKQVLSQLSTDLIEKLAVVCDKYQMSLTLSPWSEAWLLKTDGSLYGDQNHPRMLWISYALRNQSAFYKFSREMICGYTESSLLIAKAKVEKTCLPVLVLGNWCQTCSIACGLTDAYRINCY